MKTAIILQRETLTRVDVYKRQIYVFSKIYDNEIMTLTADQTAAIVGDWPWLMDSITNIINPESNIFAEIDAYGLASGTAIWDHKLDNNWSTPVSYTHLDVYKRQS